MRVDQGSIIDQAISWHVRLAEANEDVWADFVGWLEQSPAHADAYDVVAAQDQAVGAAQFPDPAIVHDAANDNPRTRWSWAIGGTLAAAAIAALIVPGMLPPRADPYEVATQPGQRRTVALGDGTSIEMSGGTRLRLDRADPRVAALDQGEAIFHVRHDDARPFAITSGKITIRDLGTVFNVAREGDRLSVAVSEGSVLFQPDREALTLLAGDALNVRERSGQIVRSKVTLASVGGWRSGMLSFSGQPLGEVAATLNRLYATNLTLEDDLSARPFTGMVRFEGKADRDVPHLAALIGANWRRDGEGWILSADPKASR